MSSKSNLPPPLPKAPVRRLSLKICIAILALPVVCALILFRIYEVDTHHSSRAGIWWPERGRNLIPPTATDITLRRDLLDHYATYTVSEKDLNAFLALGRRSILSARDGPRTPRKSEMSSTLLDGW